MEISKENLAKNSLSDFLVKHSEISLISAVDDILLSYMVSCLEDIDTDADSSETFDINDFTEMMEAYLPGFGNISSEAVSNWMYNLATRLKEQENSAANKTVENPANTDDLSKYIPKEVATNGYKCKQRNRSYSSSSSNAGDEIQSRVRTLSSNSNYSDKTDGATGTSTQDFDDDIDIENSIKMLLEMFPAACKLEATHCLHVVNGNLEKAAQVMLHRQDAGESITDTQLQQNTPVGKKSRATDKQLKDGILAKYSYVDTDDDRREHKPLMPKKFQEQKKMVRYLDGQVVSTKGERFTEIKKKEDEEMKKTYVNLKPAKQYRFH